MSNLNTPGTNYSEAAIFWKDQFAAMGSNEINTGGNNFLPDERSVFLTRELTLSEDFRNRLATITDDPLTTFGIITSMFALLFSRYQSSSSAIFMVPCLKNESTDDRLFPLLLQREGGDTLKDYLNRSLQLIEDCLNYADYPFEVLAKEQLGWEKTDISDILIFTDLHSLSGNKHRFGINIHVDPVTCGIRFEYDPQIFPAYRASLVQGHLDQIEKTFGDFNTSIEGIELLTPNEIKYLDSLNPPVNETDNQTFIDLFNESVKKYPDYIALRFEGNTLTYKELDLKSSKLAAYFKRELGTQTGSTIALLAERSALTIIGILGILKSGAVYVPVDPAYPKERIEYLLTASGAETLVTTSAYLFDIPFFAGNIFAIDLQLDDLPEVASGFNVSIDAQSLAYIIFTSGSTGRPKGVEISHANVFNYLNWAKDYYFRHNPDGGSFALFTPVSFDLTITSIFVPLIRGKHIEIFGDRDAGEILAEIFDENGGADTVKLTPSHISLLAQLPAGNNNVRTIIAGGEALRDDHVAIIKDKWPDILIFNEYGPTEATVGCTVTEVSTGNITIGLPIANVSIYILDQNRRLLPAGAVGEIYIGGVCLARGYRGQAEQTRSVFVDSPFTSGERIYRTGDLGLWLENGNLKYMGRKDNQVKIRGYRIETEEIENALLEIPGIKDAAVVPCFNNATSTSLTAFYTVTGEDAPKSEEIEHILAQKLPLYMRPSLIICLEKLPLTPNFKIDRKKLAEMESGAINENYTAPVSETEQILVNVFAEVLGREKIGIDDNFFAIGGDSIIGIQIVSRANRAGIMITLKQLFKQLTIAGLAAVAEKAAPVVAEQGPVYGDIEIIPVHKWFFDQRPNRISHYNQSVILKVGTGFDPSCMAAALMKIMEHHDMLRMRVRLKDGSYEEYIPQAVAIDPNFSIKEFAGTYGASLQNQLLEDMSLLQAGMDVFNGPILAAIYYKLEDEKESLLFLAAHHLIIDGVSWRILLEDLSAVYTQLKLGQVVHLPEKTDSFKKFATKALQYSSANKLVNELSFWANENRMEAATGLPVDLNGDKEKNTVKNALTHTVKLDEETTKALISAAHTAYNTNVNDLLLAALVSAFSNYTSQRSLLIAMEGHGREDVFENIDVSRTVGWFTSIYPILLELDDTNGPSSVITSLKEQLRQIPDNGIGYGLLKYGNTEDYIKTALSYLPKPEVIFNYLGQSAQALPDDLGWKISPLQTGSDQDGDVARDYLIEINAIVIDDSLVVDWTYCPQLHNEDTIKKLAHDYLEALKELITHCLEAGSGGYTPSDFPEANLEQDQLDQLISQFKFSN